MPTIKKLRKKWKTDFELFGCDPNDERSAQGSHNGIQHSHAALSIVSSRLVPYVSSHKSHSEGGRKCHIGYYKDGKPICGTKHSQYDTTDAEITPEWILTGVQSNELCIKCAKKALSIMEADLDVC